MLTQLCAPNLIRKRRYELTCNELDWIVDEIEDSLEGLVLAEIELHRAGQDIEPPPWAGA